MSSAHSLGHPQRLPSIPNITPIVFIVDQDASVRGSLERLVRSEGWLAESFESARDLLAHPLPVVPTCLVLNLTLPDLNGLELQRKIARRGAEVPTIFISANEDIRATVQAMKAGAVNFFVKPFRSDSVLCAIREGLERSRLAIDREMEIRDLRYCYALLTPRERQVMALVVSGLLNKQVAGELRI